MNILIGRASGKTESSVIGHNKKSGRIEKGPSFQIRWFVGVIGSDI